MQEYIICLSRRPFNREFKWAALQRLERGSSVGEVARAFEINPNMRLRWRLGLQLGRGNGFAGVGKGGREEGRVAELERKIGQQALEIDFLRRCLQRIDEQRELQAVTGKPLLENSSALGYRPPEEFETWLPEPSGRVRG